MPQAVSTFSSVRSTSARASGSDLPFSSAIWRASVSRSSRIRAASLNSGATRVSTGVADQAGKALRAAATAASRSAARDSGTRAMVAPVEGFSTSSASRPPGSVHPPST